MSLVERLREARKFLAENGVTIEPYSGSLYGDAADRLEQAEKLLQEARGALADIATSEDMTLDLARTKAARVYAATDIDAFLPVHPTTTKR